VSPDRELQKDSLRDLWLLRLEITEGWKSEMMRVIDAKEDTQRQIQNSGRKEEEEKSEDPEKILIIDREGSLRTVDLVEEVKDPKQEHNH
jgi:hypothetical protein